MNPLRWIKDLVVAFSSLGRRQTAMILAIITSLVFAVVVWKISKVDDPIRTIVILTMLALLILSFVPLVRDIFSRSRRRIQIVAWKGYNEREMKALYEKKFGKGAIDVLEYVRGIRHFGQLRYN
jgi:hypothetical protein